MKYWLRMKLGSILFNNSGARQFIVNFLRLLNSNFSCRKVACWSGCNFIHDILQITILWEHIKFSVFTCCVTYLSDYLPRIGDISWDRCLNIFILSLKNFSNCILSWYFIIVCEVHWIMNIEIINTFPSILD